MIESPFLDEYVEHQLQNAKVVEKSPVFRKFLIDTILRALKVRFQDVPKDLARAIRKIKDPTTMVALNEWAFACPSLEAFRSRLKS